MKRDIEQTVVNLLKKAESVAGTPEEQTFKAKAMELIAKYNFDEARLRDTSQGKAEIVCEEIVFTGHHVKSQCNMFYYVAEALGCKAIQISSTTIEVFGTESAVDQADWLFNLVWFPALTQVMDPNATRHLGRGEKTVWRRNFLQGYTASISRRIRDAYNKAYADANNDAGGKSEAGLVLLDEAKRSRDAMLKSHPDAVVKRSNSRANYGALLSGSNAAQRSDIGQSRMGSQKALN